MSERGKRLIPDRLVRARYSVTSMTLHRWDHHPTLNFPRPFRIQGRKYRAESELNEFDQRMRPADDDDPGAATDGEVA